MLWKMLIGAIISGVLSYFSVYFSVRLSKPFDDVFYYGPGLIFAVMIIGFLLKNKYIRPSPRIGLWAIVSYISYFIAVQTTFFLGNFGDGFDSITNNPTAFFIGGLVGAALMLLGFHFLMIHLERWSYFLLVLLGGILSLSFFWFDESLFPITIEFIYHGVFELFVIWQTGMAAAMAYVLSTRSHR